MRKLARVLVSTLLVAGATAPAVRAAEGSGTVVGTVVDAAHNAVSEMIVKATDVVDPSKIFTGVSDKNGRFMVSDMPSGSYLVSADTVNTTWIQKDDSPIVEVSGAARPNVTLVLVKQAEFMPNAVGDCGHGLGVATIGVAALAAVAAITAVVNTNDLQDQNDDLVRANAALAAQLADTEAKLTAQQVQLNRQLNELSDQNSAEAHALQDQIDQLNREIINLQHQIAVLQNTVNRIPTSSPFR